MTPIVFDSAPETVLGAYNYDMTTSFYEWKYLNGKPYFILKDLNLSLLPGGQLARMTVVFHIP